MKAEIVPTALTMNEAVFRSNMMHELAFSTSFAFITVCSTLDAAGNQT